VKTVAKRKKKERRALMADEDFEGDFLEVQENNHWFDSKSGMKMTFKNGSKCILTYVIATIKFVCVYNKLFQKSFN
jgi:hypothetical protein